MNTWSALDSLLVVTFPRCLTSVVLGDVLVPSGNPFPRPFFLPPCIVSFCVFFFSKPLSLSQMQPVCGRRFLFDRCCHVYDCLVPPGVHSDQNFLPHHPPFLVSVTPCFTEALFRSLNHETRFVALPSTRFSHDQIHCCFSLTSVFFVSF